MLDMRKYLVISYFIISLFCVVYLLKSKLVTTTMQYFPIDEHVMFDDARTDLTYSYDETEVHWTIDSKSSESAYLRQDISLLFENGKFKGVQNKWEQHKQKLSLTQKFKQKNNG